MKSRGLLLGVVLGGLASHAPAVDPGYVLKSDTESTPAIETGKAPPALEPRQVARVVTVPALHWAAIGGDLVEVRRLLDDGASVSATETLWGGERALHYGAYGGNPGVVQALLDAGASIEAQDDSGETALRESLRNDDTGYRTLQVLLVAGADAEARSNDGSTALHEAVALSSEHAQNAVLLLRMFGADPNARTTESQATPMHYAVLQPYDRFSGWQLLSTTYDPSARSADLNAKDDEGQTPLHWLALNSLISAQDPRVALWLLVQGADPRITNDEGLTASEVAEQNGAEELAALLRRAEQ